MIYSYLFPTIIAIATSAYFLGVHKAKATAEASGGVRNLHSLPSHHGFLLALSAAIPGLFLFGIWQVSETSIITWLTKQSLPTEMLSLSANEFSLVMNDIKNAVKGDIVSSVNKQVIHDAAQIYLNSQEYGRTIVQFVILGVTLLGAFLAHRSIHIELRSRNIVEGIIKIILICCSAVAIFTTLGIVMSVLFEALQFFKAVSPVDFLFGLNWSPQVAMRADQAGSSGAFGAVPIFAGTLLIALIAMMVAIPIGLMAAIYLSEYASERLRTWAKPILEILAGIPTVVYGFFAALTVAPLVRDTGTLLGLDVSSESALAAGLVMGIMIIPFVSSLSDDVIHAVPQSLRDGSYGLGATKYETIKNVVFPAALPGIVGSILLAVSRAIGETMIVVMAAGLSANLTFNPLKAVTTVTVQIVTLLTGDQEFDSPKTLAAFALGLFLFIFTLILNIIALHVVRKYREQYD